MRLAFVAPDCLTLINVCGPMLDLVRRAGGHEAFTLGQADIFKPQLDRMFGTHLALPMSRFASPLQDLRYFASLYKCFKHHRFDAVLSITTKPNVYGGLAARLAGVPKILLAVRGGGRAFKGAAAGPFRARLSRLLYRQACAMSSYVWFINPLDFEYFVQHGIVTQPKALLTNNGIDLQRFSPEAVPPGTLKRLRQELGLRDSDLVVVMVARMIWSKGIREYVEAAERLRDRLSNVHFLLIGPREEHDPELVPDTYLRAAESRARLRWLGYRTDTRELYALADAAVLPSYYTEGCPRGLLEPMAMGKALIAAESNEYVPPVEHGHNGYLVKPRDSLGLAEALVRILDDPAAREAFGRRSREKAQAEFDARAISAKPLARLGLEVA